ncbi:MAG: hypothetical protein NTW29_15025, partial [Bacteroidetes bacterium]|nr:hypothetical protein [Bacteroidota bacterium]
TCSLLTNAWNFLSPDYRPNTTGAGAVVVDPTNLNSGADLTPIVQIDGALFTANQATDFVIGVLENDSGTTNGVVTVTIPKLSGWSITVSGITLTGVNQSGINGNSNVGGGTPNNNGSWNFRDDGANIIATSKAGVVIAKNDFSQVGFVATRLGATSNGTNQNLGVFIVGGGDSTPANNSAVTGFSAN